MPKRKKKQKPWQVRDTRKRSKQVISPRKRYLICTEGKSEAVYFGHYKSSTGPLVVPLNKSDHKVSLVKKTIEERNTRIKNGEFDKGFDETWVVLDRDADPLNKQDKLHFNEALSLAEKHTIFVAYSNDAFELWYVLHYQDLRTRTHRDQLIKLLSSHLGKKYEKPNDVYREIKGLRSKALKRAANLLMPKVHPENANPSTTIHQLVEKLLNEPGFREED